jgi:integration host factor subunit beta
MNKADLIEVVRSMNGFSREQADDVVNLFFNEMACALAKGQRVEIRGFGSFFVKKYRSYIGRNPKTGQTVKVKPKKLPFFRCGRELRIRVDGIL